MDPTAIFGKVQEYGPLVLDAASAALKKKTTDNGSGASRSEGQAINPSAKDGIELIKYSIPKDLLGTFAISTIFTFGAGYAENAVCSKQTSVSYCYYAPYVVGAGIFACCSSGLAILGVFFLRRCRKEQRHGLKHGNKMGLIRQGYEHTTEAASEKRSRDKIRHRQIISGLEALSPNDFVSRPSKSAAAATHKEPGEATNKQKSTAETVETQGGTMCIIV